MHTNVSTHSAQRSQIPLELGLQTVVRCLMRVLEVRLSALGKVVCTLHH